MTATPRDLTGRIADTVVGPSLPSVAGGTALVTGASSGIGRAVAVELLRRGFHVFGTSRDPAAVTEPPEGVRFLHLDLADGDSVESCAQRFLDAAATTDPVPDAATGPTGTPVDTGPLVLVNNAGESQFGALEDIPDREMDRLFRINVLGQLALTRRLLPVMRTRGRGRVVMVGSMLGSFPLAYRSTYVASKAALHGAATSIRGEMAPFGVGVSTVEPGSVATGISQRRTICLPDDSAHGGPARTVLAGLDANEAGGISAEQVTEKVVHAICHHRPHAYYAVGSGAPLTTLARRLLPEQTLATVVARRHGLR